jgi:hypothetical protein
MFKEFDENGINRHIFCEYINVTFEKYIVMNKINCF